MATPSHEDFVRAWQSSRSIKEVCEKIGLDCCQVRARKSYLRRKGVDLKPFRECKPLDIPNLQRIAQETLAKLERSQNQPAAKPARPGCHPTKSKPNGITKGARA